MSGVQENMLYFQSYDGKKNNFIFIIFQEKLWDMVVISA